MPIPSSTSPFDKAIGHDDDANYRSRLWYISEITHFLRLRPKLSFPTAHQHKLYDDALRHVCRLVTSDHRDRGQEAFTKKNKCECSQKKRKSKKTRKEVLKEILSRLVCLQCDRLYDPPADDEIAYYLLIKRYIRSIMVFFDSGPDIDAIEGWTPHKFRCCRAIGQLHHMEELSELNQHLADLAVFVSEADFRIGSSVTPLMAIKLNEKIDLHPLIEESKERRNAFYLNKFMLAEFDLSYSEFAHCPPLEEEMRLYIQMLDDLQSPSSVPVKEPNVFSDLLSSLFLERTEREIKDLERHCRRIKDLVLDKLSLSDRYELIHEQFKLLVDCHDAREDLEEEIDLTDFKRELVRKCEVSAKDLTNYFRCVDQYQRIAVNVAVFIISRLSDAHYQCHDFCSEFKYGESRRCEAAWQVLHSLTILKQGRFFFGTVLQEHSIAQISKKRARAEFQQAAKWMQKCSTKKGKNRNLKILRGIVEDLRCIGVSDIKTDDEEDQLVAKIWWNVASSVQFFLSTIAYEQRHYISKCGGLPDGRIPGLRTTQRKRYTSVGQLKYRLSELANEVSDLSFILAALRDGLLEKTGNDGPCAIAI